MTEQQTTQTIFQLLKHIAPDSEPEKLKPEDDIRHTLELDSFDALQFVVAGDEHFGINIPEEDYGKITSVRDLLNYITEKKNKIIQ